MLSDLAIYVNSDSSQCCNTAVFNGCFPILTLRLVASDSLHEQHTPSELPTAPPAFLTQKMGQAEMGEWRRRGPGGMTEVEGRAEGS